MPLRLTDTQLDAWIDQNGPVPTYRRYTAEELATIRKFSGFKAYVSNSYTRNLGKPFTYGEFSKWLDACDEETRAQDAALAKRLSSPDAPKLYFVPGRGLQDVPF